MEQGIPQYRENKFEHSLSYQRPDGNRMEVAFIHLPGTEPVLRVALYEEGELEPVSEGPGLNMQEVQWRYKFYKWLYESGLVQDQAS